MQPKETWKTDFLNANNENANENCAKSIRKYKKEETIMLKRSASKKDDQINPEAVVGKCIPAFQAATTLSDKVNAIIGAYTILNEEAIYNSIEFIRLHIAKEEKLVMDSLHILVNEIKKSHSTRCKCVSILALINFTAESSKYSPIIVSDMALVLEIISNIKSANTDLIENCLTCLGNLCSDSVVARDTLSKNIEQSTIISLLNDKALVNAALFMLHMMLIGSHTCIEYLTTLANLLMPFLKHSDEEIICDAFIITARIMALSKAKYPSYCSQICTAMEYLSSSKDGFILCAIQFLIEVVNECNDSFSVTLIEMKVIPVIEGLVGHNNGSIARQSCKLIIGLSQKHAIDLNKGSILKKLMNLTVDTICDTSRYALWSILELLQNLSYEHIKLVDLSIIFNTCNKIISVSLDFYSLVMSYLRACQRILKSEGENMEFLDTFVVCDGEDMLSKLEVSHNPSICAFVEYIKEEFLINKYQSIDL